LNNNTIRCLFLSPSRSFYFSRTRSHHTYIIIFTRILNINRIIHYTVIIIIFCVPTILFFFIIIWTRTPSPVCVYINVYNIIMYTQYYKRIIDCIFLSLFFKTLYYLRAGRTTTDGPQIAKVDSVWSSLRAASWYLSQIISLSLLFSSARGSYQYIIVSSE